MNDVRTWEKKHGQVPKDAFVALRTDWSKRWPDAKKMQNADERQSAVKDEGKPGAVAPAS
jgi:kynurenine formamidase